MEKEIQLNIPTDVKPLFADDILVSLRVKADKDEKEVYVNLKFFVIEGKRVVADVTISKITAKSLLAILTNQLSKAEEKTSSTTYIG
ncbi:MAG: hypothetical protein RMJ17_00275 [Candidatus Aenigmarchaeota archaeon]|nr:hypothetical protein [Candidatus Aenigmarchaeota archaeon]MDW8149026.1 hypothetical protein [Candidatus Aenigmarchaeota archaeon]